jgi:hypothetical protein
MVDAALLELPWYTELDLIWHSNPAMAAVTHSSKPGIDHTSALYALIQQHGGASPPTNSGATPQWSPHAPTYPQHDTIHIIPLRLHNAANTILQALHHIMLLPLMVLLPLPLPLPPILPLAPHPLDSTSLAFRP